MKPKAAKPEFPPECCAACRFSHPDLDVLKCWVDGPWYDEDRADHVRGVPTKPNWPACKDFKPRHHG